MSIFSRLNNALQARQSNYNFKAFAGPGRCCSTIINVIIVIIDFLFCRTSLCIGDDNITMDAEPCGPKMLHTDGLVVNHGASPDCRCSWSFKKYARTLAVWFTPSGVKQR